MTCFVFKISGSHFNPAITLAHMIKREDKMPIGLGVAYMVVQLIGGYLGACLVNFYVLGMPILEYNDEFIVRSLM